MLSNQKQLFSISDDVIYLNGAYMSPQLKSVEEIGISSLKQKGDPAAILPKHFFEQRAILKQCFAELINTSALNIAIIPSVSYGIANAANNVLLQKGDEILLVDEQFPSNVYAWNHVAEKNNAHTKIVLHPSGTTNRAKKWNELILNAISNKTAVVAMPHAHWADGTLFDLKAIREKTNLVGAKLIIDGTQSVGALPFDVNELQPDALICGGYKWLMGPYSLGVAYYNESFFEGTPIEHNWMNRYESENFAKLVDYQDQYKPGAERFSVGESSNFVLTPMLTRAIEQLLEWKPESIQEYCHEISKNAISKLRDLGCFIEDDDFRTKHLFGIYLADHMNMSMIKKKMAENNIIVSFRGNAIRISPHLYNTKEDFETLVRCFE
ncbi:aminotransferase class V-fold PLP-dependent enzyme [Spongiivirga citrea]|uniref:Aminotransferase class V-fold PLP-dependent enzyme n=2 Tax=Spongiivirga citrea TaxID=1481457 RepID=A0A6M0CPS3_9FLAO|nr:aminotransferase class V-fold PLP-dependent enzyme [Spongiivirga citrea]